MRVRIDRGGEALRLELGAAPAARRVEAAEGVAVGYDSAGRIVGIEIRGVDPAALHAFTVGAGGPGGSAARAGGSAARGTRCARTPRARRRPTTPGRSPGTRRSRRPMLQVPFFSRGQRRLDAGKLARQRGSDRVTIDIVQPLGGR